MSGVILYHDALGEVVEDGGPEDEHLATDDGVGQGEAEEERLEGSEGSVRGRPRPTEDVQKAPAAHLVMVSGTVFSSVTEPESLQYRQNQPGLLYKLVSRVTRG